MSEYVWLNELSEQFLSKGYLVKGQTVDERVDIICNTAERILGIEGFAAKLKGYFQRGWLSFSTPIWANFGTKRGMPISCFGSYIGDSMESILRTHSEVGMMTKLGGGTSGFFGKLRPRGSAITDLGDSSGAVHFAQLYNAEINIISQGNTRRGNFAAYLPIDHPDIMEFLNIRSEGNAIQDLSFGITVPDYWMEEMIRGDYAKRTIWAKVLNTRAMIGFPYIVFIDNANNGTVDVYKDKGMKIHHSNLCCVTGDQRVSSDRGLLTAKELYEQGGPLVLFDNDKVVNASPMFLVKKNADVYRITLENGMSHTITEEHRVKTSSGRDKTSIKECRDLVVGDRVAIQTRKGLFGVNHMPDEAFLLGVYQSDGTQTANDIMIDVWENDFDLVDEIECKFESIHNKYGCDRYDITDNRGCTRTRSRKAAKFHNCQVREGSSAKKRLSSRTLKKALDFRKGEIPDWIWESDESTQWEYVRGLLFADGAAFVSNSNGNPVQISYSDINREFLQELQILFANLGVQTSIRILRKAGTTRLPNGKGGYSEYQTKNCYRLIVGSKNDALAIEEKTGFLSRKGVSLENREYRDNTKKFYEINSIEYVGKEDVYCCQVDSDEHLWVCNGVVTHNSEILLPNNILESFVCDLASLNILYFDEWKDTDLIEVVVMLLDAVMTEFIEKARNIPFMDRAVRFAERHRALGIGWLGWHSYLQSKMIAWESMEAKFANVAIAKHIHDKAYAASAKMAEMFGEPEVLKGYGRRHTTLMAIAPTKSSAFILGQVSEGIEPFRSNYYIKDLQKGKFTIRNPYLEKLLREKGQDTEPVWESIIKRSGSVQHLTFLSDHEKNVFKTFCEISPKEIIIQAAQRQKYVDQGQSTNLMIHPSVSAKDVNALLIDAWKMGIKSLYYQHSVNAAQEFSRNILTCQSCEA